MHVRRLAFRRACFCQLREHMSTDPEGTVHLWIVSLVWDPFSRGGGLEKRCGQQYCGYSFQSLLR